MEKKRSSDDFLMKSNGGRIIMSISLHVLMDLDCLGHRVDGNPRGSLTDRPCIILRPRDLGAMFHCD